MSVNFLNHRVFCSVFCFLFFHSVETFSQKGFYPGYIISPANDTIQVRIKLGELNKNQCVYIDPSGKNCIGNPETVKSFAVSDGRKFRYLKFEGTKNPVDAYFEVLVEGKMNLFAFKDRFFVQKDNDEIYELLNTEESGVNEKGVNYIKKKQEYFGLLKFLLSDATTSISDLMYLDYGEKDLIRVIRIYNEGEAYIQELDRQKYKPNFKFGIEALYASDNYKFRFPSDSFADEYEGRFLLPGVGGVVKCQFTRQLLVSSGVRLKYLDYSIYKSYGGEFSRRYYTLKNNYFTLSIPLILDRQFDNLSFHPCVGLGLQIEKSFLKNNTCLEESNNYSGTDFYTYENQADFLHPFNLYWTVEVGGNPTIGKLSLNIKAQYLMDISAINSAADGQFYHKSGLQLILGVMF